MTVTKGVSGVSGAAGTCVPERPTCRGCGISISRGTKSGKCAPCCASDPDIRARKGRLSPEQKERRRARLRDMMADPAIAARRARRVREAHADPEVQTRHAAACAAAAAKRMQDPDHRRKLQEIGRTIGASNLRRGLTPESRARAARTHRANVLAWCPPEHWGLNATLKRKGCRLAERKAIIASEVAAKQKRPSPPPPPPGRRSFEEQLAAVARGAPLVRRVAIVTVDPDMTLGGVSAGML